MVIVRAGHVFIFSKGSLFYSVSWCLKTFPHDFVQFYSCLCWKGEPTICYIVMGCVHEKKNDYQSFANFSEMPSVKIIVNIVWLLSRRGRWKDFALADSHGGSPQNVKMLSKAHRMFLVMPQSNPVISGTSLTWISAAGGYCRRYSTILMLTLYYYSLIPILIWMLIVTLVMFIFWMLTVTWAQA